MLRIEPMKEDQAESAILELVDGPKDMRFAMTAKALSRTQPRRGFSPKQVEHIKKVTQFRKDGVEELSDMVQRMRLHQQTLDERTLPPPRKVYPTEKFTREMHYFEDVDQYKLPNKLPEGEEEAQKRLRTKKLMPWTPQVSEAQLPKQIE